MVVLVRALPLALVPALVPIPVLTRAAAGPVPVIAVMSVAIMADEDAAGQGQEDGAEEAEVEFHGARELIHTAGPKRSCLKAPPVPRSCPLFFVPPASIR